MAAPVTVNGISTTNLSSQASSSPCAVSSSSLRSLCCRHHRHHHHRQPHPPSAVWTLRSLAEGREVGSYHCPALQRCPSITASWLGAAVHVQTPATATYTIPAFVYTRTCRGHVLLGIVSRSTLHFPFTSVADHDHRFTAGVSGNDYLVIFHRAGADDASCTRGVRSVFVQRCPVASSAHRPAPNDVSNRLPLQYDEPTHACRRVPYPPNTQAQGEHNVRQR